ncbi:MAG TPA: LysM peptidoglycan-binding domain-containing protein [Dehalococcoidia bacterium]|nr:LysM peptidoglycan-binding domain-containing protein [Dehalococcoidia bacterium]
MHCYACEKEAEQQCQRCGKLYCEDHGDNLCGECLNPASAVPSPTIYRGSLLALVAGTAIVIWLLLAPPALPGDAVTVSEPETESEVSAPVESDDDSAEEAEPTVPPAEATTDPGASPTADATESAGISCPEGTTASGEQCIYTVVAGDTLSTIAVRFGVTEAAINEANGLSGEPLQIGQALIIPSS